MERVLVVDDERDCLYALADSLAAKGLRADTAENGRAALEIIRRRPTEFSLVYSDIRMPEVDGIELVANLSAINPTIVTVLLTGHADSRSAVAAMRAGAFDFLSKPFTLSELEISLARAIERRRVLVQHEEDRTRLHTLLEMSEKEKRDLMIRHEDEMQRLFVSSVRAHARSIEAKDPYTAGHCDRVERYVEIIARQHGGFDEKWIFNLRVGAILHDIGKIGVNGDILCKPGVLAPCESDEIRSHPVIGGRIVRSLYAYDLEPIVRHHHERFDGTGYPSGLKGEDIPVESRLIFIADTFDAMTSNRPYRRATSTEKTLQELEKHAGTQFDPHLVKVALKASAHLEAARAAMSVPRQKEYFEDKPRIKRISKEDVL
jgi:response regulator RpfG family c-di-GMP phosphodiesterase